ncbi:MAG: ATPase, T2SS/T4P/T4SS family [Gemmatimonadaceae bacterium]
MLAGLLPAHAVNAITEATGESFWQAAVVSGFISETALLAEVARLSRTVIATRLAGTKQAREAVPEHLARRFQVLPLSVSASTLEIATSNPYDMECEQMLAFASGRAVRMSLATPLLIAERIDETYAPRSSRNHVPATGGIIHEAFSQPLSASSTLPAGDTVVQLVDRIVTEGIECRASDIHLEPEENGIAIRYRVDGLLRHATVLPKPVGLPLVSRIKIMAKMDIADRLRPQGGHASVALNGDRIDLRISTLPASHGEKVVIRILDPRSAIRSLESLGLDEFDAPRIKKLLEVREGLILVTGPTGSGKTTTLYSALSQIQRRGVNIVTVEDPVEYRIAGIVQVQINDKAGLTFASALRSILRQDPDVVLIGEIRDRETAAIAIQASLTGHLVFATLHTNDACSSITRLTDLGVDSGKLSAALKGVIAQRLIRKLCDCRVVASGGAPAKLRQSVAQDAMVHSAAGCARCGMSGYRGRIAVTEIVLVDADLERSIAARSSVDALAAAGRRGGARSLWESGIAHLLRGETDGDELLRVLEQQVRAPERRDPQSTGARDAPDTAGESPVVFDSVGHAIHRELPINAPNSNMTGMRAGVVDVYLIRPLAGGWKVLAVQRAIDTRCPNAWETVHGRLNDDERPEDGAMREVTEETGLTISRLYNVTVQPFYLHMFQTVQLAIVFAAFVDEPATVTLGDEHQHYEWLAMDEAAERFVWPREVEALAHIRKLLGSGDAGPVEDVLRVF